LSIDVINDAEIDFHSTRFRMSGITR
jgi:hypothetical protein